MPYSSKPIFPRSSLGVGALALPFSRSLIWQTRGPKTVAGVEVLQADWTYPRYQYKISVAYLRDAAAYGELATLAGFINQLGGRYGVFQYDDPKDDTVSTPQNLGTGDGTTTVFQLVRGYGGYVEPVFAINTATIFVQDWQGNNVMFQTPRTNLLLWSFTFSFAGWGKVNSTATIGQTDPQTGGSLAWLWQRSSTAAAYIHQTISKASSAIQYSYELVAKAGTGNFCALRLDDTGVNQADVVFNLSLGTISTPASVTGAFTSPSATIRSIGSGWYVISLTATSNAVAAVDAIWSFSSNGVLVDGTDSVSNTTGIAYWAQLEPAAVSGTFIGTTTVAVTRTDVTITNKGVASFTIPPASGAIVTWTGTYFWFCRFDQDQQDFTMMAAALASDPYGALWSTPLTFSTIKFGS